MKRYFFEPGAVKCYRKRGLRARLVRGLQVVKGLVQVVLGGHPSDTLGHFLLLAAMVAAVAACVGSFAGYVQFQLDMGVIR
ncbi:hypothetical protein [Comamonas resistens]|uniref:hypothetical protein n=1 Tax=Comamonas resistens TaxID=3046670 RepID=UPI0039BC60BF